MKTSYESGGSAGHATQEPPAIGWPYSLSCPAWQPQLALTRLLGWVGGVRDLPHRQQSVAVGSPRI